MILIHPKAKTINILVHDPKDQDQRVDVQSCGYGFQYKEPDEDYGFMYQTLEDEEDMRELSELLQTLTTTARKIHALYNKSK